MPELPEFGDLDLNEICPQGSATPPLQRRLPIWSHLRLVLRAGNLRVL
jgi:hypothetical protein